MIYDVLAPYYDALVGDIEACQRWVAFTKAYAHGSKVLDLACGSGDVSIALAKEGFRVRGIDFSKEMIACAKAKDKKKQVRFEIGDMRDLHDHEAYDVVTCYCDSLNYLLHEDEVRKVFQAVYDALTTQGVFLFDVHTQSRLDEFAQEYLEEDYLEDVGYVWSIQSEADRLYQNFIFYLADGRQITEQHMQRVYAADWLKEQLEQCGFTVMILTDFDQPREKDGEKYFFIAGKEFL